MSQQHSPTVQAQRPVQQAAVKPVMIPEWLPFADRLCPNSILDASKWQPVTSFADLPPHQLDPLSKKRIQPGSLRFFVPRSVKIEDSQESSVQVQLELLLQLRKLYPEVKHRQLPMFHEGERERWRHNYVEIDWTSEQRFDPATVLTIQGQPLRYLGAAATAEESWITVRVVKLPDLVLHEGYKTLATVLKELFQPHQILDFWTTNNIRVSRDGSTTSTIWNREVYLLIDLNMEVMKSQGVMYPSDAGVRLPGWVEYGNRFCKLLYVDRYDHCKKCKNVPFEQRHEDWECNARSCASFVASMAVSEPRVLEEALPIKAEETARP